MKIYLQLVLVLKLFFNYSMLIFKSTSFLNYLKQLESGEFKKMPPSVVK